MPCPYPPLRDQALALLLGLALSLFAGGANASPPPPEVLLLNSYHQGDEWSGGEIAGVLEGLHQAYPNMVPCIEHLDVKRFPGPEHLADVRNYLSAKYRTRRPDLIITLDNDALDFLLAVRAELFPGAPVVFAGLNGYTPGMFAGRPGITGTAEAPDMAGALKLAQRLFPGVREILFIHDDTTSGRAMGMEAAAVAARFRDRLDVRLTPRVSMAELEEMLRALSPDAVGIILTYTTDAEGRIFSREESTRRICATSPVPVLALHGTRMGYGVLGGPLLTAHDHGRQAADLARKVLAGRDPGSLPVEPGRTRLMFDFRAMRRFGVDESGLPPDSTVLFRPKTIFTEYRSQMLAGLSALGALALLSLGLAVAASRLRRSRAALAHSEERYRTVLEVLGEGVIVLDAAGRITSINRYAAEVFGISREESLGLVLTSWDWRILREDGTVLPGDERPSQRALRTGLPVNGMVLGVEIPGRETVWLSVNARPLAAPGDCASCAVALSFSDITGHKKVREELAKSNAKFRGVFERSPVGLLLIDGTGQILEANEQIVRIFGAPSRGSYIGFNALANLPEGPLKDSLRRALDGEDMHYAGWVQPVAGTRGVFLGLRIVRLAPGVFLALCEDLTAQRLAEEALRKSEKDYRDLFEKSPVGIFLTDSAGRPHHVNPEMARILGADSPEDAIARYPNLTATLYVDQERRREFIDLLRQHGTVENFEYEARHAKGGRVWLNMNARVREELPGGVLLIDGFVTDVTKRKQTELALVRSRAEIEENRAKLAMVVEMAGMGHWEMDLASNVFTFNDQFYSLYGTTAEREGGTTMPAKVYSRRFIHPDETDLVATAVAQALDGMYDDHPAEIEHRIVRRDGQVRHIVVRFAVHRDASGRRIKTIGANQDITERKRAEEALFRAKEAAEAANRSKSEFLATMSHEVRTPLNGVLGMLQLAMGTDLDPEQREYVATAMASGRSLLRVLSDILDISRIEAGALHIMAEDFRPDEVFEPISLAFENPARAKGLRFACEVDPGLPPVLCGDAGRIRQVAYNLVGNALKYTETGEVRLEAYSLPAGDSSDAIRLHLAVSDTGIGVPHGKLARIFDPFTQVDGSSTRRHGGTGLGLSIVRRLVGLMGGELSFCSEPGVGSEVHVSLPLRLAASPAPPPENPLPAPAPSGSPPWRVLLAEDDAVNHLAVSRMLAKFGHQVYSAGNGAEALHLLRGQDVDCILMDIQMPGMDGREATRRIRAGEAGESARRVPIIALTAHAMKGDRETFLADGMDGYLAKPVDMEELERTLAALARPDA